MTGQQQLDVFGVCAYEHKGKVILEDRLGAVTELDPYVARRFAFYLARAYHDALRNGRRLAGDTEAAR